MGKPVKKDSIRCRLSFLDAWIIVYSRKYSVADKKENQQLSGPQKSFENLMKLKTIFSLMFSNCKNNFFGAFFGPRILWICSGLTAVFKVL